jgi:hypothetical protein
MRNKGVAKASVVIASIVGVMAAWTVAAQQPANPRQQPGAMITMYAPEQHDRGQETALCSPPDLPF